MSDKELKLQNELLQKQNEELKADNLKKQEQIEELTEQLEKFKFDRDCAQVFNLINRRN